MATDNGPHRDVTPAPLPSSQANKKKLPDGWTDQPLTARNPPNNPKKDHQPTSFNVTDDYCQEDTGD